MLMDVGDVYLIIKINCIIFMKMYEYVCFFKLNKFKFISYRDRDRQAVSSPTFLYFLLPATTASRYRVVSRRSRSGRSSSTFPPTRASSTPSALRARRSARRSRPSASQRATRKTWRPAVRGGSRIIQTATTTSEFYYTSSRRQRRLQMTLY